MEAPVMNIVDTLQGVQRLFLDTAPVIYHVEGIVIYQPITDIIFQEISRRNGRGDNLLSNSG